MSASTVQADLQLNDELAEFVQRHTGLSFPPERHEELSRKLVVLAPRFGFDDSLHFLRWLIGRSPQRHEIQLLAAALTVGETYFFRDPRMLEALRKRIIPQVLATAAAARPPRVWCAGCSTGEEAYTLAVLLEEAGPAQEAWQVLGTDINAEALRKAEIGSYRAWSFRGGAQRLQERHVVARPGGTFQVQPYLRSRARFEYLNLAEEGYPALLTGTNAMDLILCRNVLMYFDGATIEATLGRLRRCLADGGWLVVSPVEVPLVQASPEGRQLTCVELGGLRAFRALPAARPHKHTAAAPTAPRARGRRSQVPAEDPQARPSGDPTPLEVARALADQGRLIEALALCDRAVEREPLNPELLYLQATVCEELGRPAEAAAAHRSALFADPRFVLSHFALGALEHRSGRAVAARRHFRNAAALLAGRQEEEPVGGHEPITVGRLRELLEATLRQAAVR